ncbi:MAG: LysR substrate-binding domain-containing protein [Pseudomonadota bacterium]
MQLPPLKSLKIFVICAKTKNFSKAASILNLTQSAVSKQIALLEAHLGLKLFERNFQSLDLTEVAKIYLKKIKIALLNIESATSEIITSKNKKQSKEILHINVMPSMSTAWLVPRLHDFKEKFPQYDVVVKIGDGDINFKQLGCDLAIRVSPHKNNPKWKKFSATKIMGEELLCACSPQYKKDHKIKEAKDLLNCNLLGHAYRPKMWQKYLTYSGLKNPQIHHSHVFEHIFMLSEAAKNSMGIGLLPKFLIEKELKNKELVQAIKSDFKSAHTYYILHPKQKNIAQKITDFTNWISEERSRKN